MLGQKRDKVLTTPISVNILDIQVNTINGTAIFVTIPDGTNEVYLVHRSDETIYIGGSNTVTSSTGFPLIKNEYLKLIVQTNNNNEIYAICPTGSVTLYAFSMVKE